LSAMGEELGQTRVLLHANDENYGARLAVLQAQVAADADELSRLHDALGGGGWPAGSGGAAASLGIQIEGMKAALAVRCGGPFGFWVVVGGWVFRGGWQRAW